MSNFDPISQVKQGTLDGKGLLDLLSIPCRDEKLDTTIRDKTVHITGETTDCTIQFHNSDYIVTIAFPSRLTRSQFDFDGHLLGRDYVFSVGKEKIVLSQINNLRRPKEVARSFAIMDENKDIRDASFVKYVNLGHLYQAKETVTEVNNGNGIRRCRTIEDPKNIIITNYHSESNQNLQNRAVSTISPTAPTIFTCTKAVTNPEQIQYLTYYHEPVIMIDGQFDSLRKENGTFKYQLMILKREGQFDILLTVGINDGKQYFATSYPANQEDLTPKEIGELIEQFKQDGFLRFEEYPLEETLVTELMKMKKDLAEKTYLKEYAKDPIADLLSQDILFEGVMTQVYNNLQQYYDLAHQQVYGTDKKGYYS